MSINIEVVQNGGIVKANVGGYHAGIDASWVYEGSEPKHIGEIVQKALAWEKETEGKRNKVKEKNG